MKNTLVFLSLFVAVPASAEVIETIPTTNAASVVAVMQDVLSDIRRDEPQAVTESATEMSRSLVLSDGQSSIQCTEFAPSGFKDGLSAPQVQSFGCRFEGVEHLNATTINAGSTQGLLWHALKNRYQAEQRASAPLEDLSVERRDGQGGRGFILADAELSIFCREYSPHTPKSEISAPQVQSYSCEITMTAR